MTFLDKLTAITLQNHSWLCVGLDPDPTLMPIPKVSNFNEAIIEETKDVVCAYKLNLAFYEALGLEGWQALEYTIKRIPNNIPIIGDGKRGDIGNTAKKYAKALYETWGFDAATVNPYLGEDSIQPYVNYCNKGVFIICRTSNPGARDFQDLETIAENKTAVPLYEQIAISASKWNRYGNIGLVIGATYPQELEIVRRRCPEMPILIPGVGSQGGDLENSVSAGSNAQGENAIINVSRQILYASTGDKFASAAGREARKLRNAIIDILKREE